MTPTHKDQLNHEMRCHSCAKLLFKINFDKMVSYRITLGKLQSGSECEIQVKCPKCKTSNYLNLEIGDS